MAVATLPMPGALASGPPIVAPLPISLDRPAVLALDLGTTTGWALRGPDGGITSGTITFRPSRFEGGGMRYLRFRGWLGELALLTGSLAPREQMLLALAAYATYALNAAQFLLKLRAARLERPAALIAEPAR